MIVLSGAKTANKAPRKARSRRPKQTLRDPSGASKLSMATVKADEVLLFDAVAPSRGALKVGPMREYLRLGE